MAGFLYYGRVSSNLKNLLSVLCAERRACVSSFLTLPFFPVSFPHSSFLASFFIFCPVISLHLAFFLSALLVTICRCWPPMREVSDLVTCQVNAPFHMVVSGLGHWSFDVHLACICLSIPGHDASPGCKILSFGFGKDIVSLATHATSRGTSRARYLSFL